MPRSVVVSVGISWGGLGTRTCGISVGRAEIFVGSRNQPCRHFGLRLPATGSRLAHVAG